MSYTKLLVVALSVLPGALAAALPHEGHVEGRQCTGCTPPNLPPGFCPKITSEEPYLAEAWTTGNSGVSGGTVSVQKSYAVGSSWSIGGDLGLGFEKLLSMSASLAASVSISYEDSTAVGVEYPCPEGGNFRCSLNVQHGMMRVKGHMEQLLQGQSCEHGIHASEGDYEATMPRKDDSGNSVFEARICLCCSGLDADNPKAPEECCVDPCAGGKRSWPSGSSGKL